MNACVGASRQVPDKESIDIAKQGVSGLGQLARATNVLQNPTNLQTAEVSGERQAGLLAETILPASLAEFSDPVCDAGVLPNQGVHQRLSSLAVPHDSGLTLVCNSDCRQFSRAERFFLHRLADDFLGPAPDFFRIMFDPPGLGINLLMLSLGRGYDPPRPVKYDESSAGRSLIDRANVACQFGPRPHRCYSHCHPTVNWCRGAGNKFAGRLVFQSWVAVIRKEHFCAAGEARRSHYAQAKPVIALNC